ncbi:MAG TPA: helicase C-terminal domain-containing protein [Herpetosiphonaceae bacterium]
MEPTYIALDLETTGLEPGNDEIIEIGAIKFRGEQVLDTYQTLVKPRRALPIKVARLTGIAAADLEGAPSFNSVGADLARFLKTYPIVGHSISLDLRFLAAQGLRVNQPSYDTFDLATLLIPQAPRYALSSLAEHMGIAVETAHRAVADAETSRLLFLRLLDRMAEMSVGEIHQIAEMTATLNWPTASLFRDLAKRRVKTVWQEPPTFKPKVVERPQPLEPTGDLTPLDLDAVEAFFGASGALSRAFPGYEPRPQQAEMARAVAAALNEGETLMVEAGTGTGKSMAYLAPAAQFARRRGERVVISTNTINLQDQLFTKDIPALQRVLANEGDTEPLNAVLLKGRGNYLCLKRYETLRAQPTHHEDETKALVKLQLWLPSTATGDRSEVLLMQNEQATWNSVNVNPDQCLRQRCPLYSECYYYKARHEAEAAHLIVVNHALMLSDLNSPGILPRYDHLIVDEAHNLEDVATDQLGFSVPQGEVSNFLDAVHLAGGPKLVQGLLAEWPAHFKLSTVNPKDRQRLEDLGEKLRPHVDRAREHAATLFAGLVQIMQRDSSYTQYDPRVRLTEKIRGRPTWGPIEQAWENLSLNLKALGDGLSAFHAALEPLENRDIADFDGLLMQVKGLFGTAEKLQERLDTVIYGNPEFVAWLGYDQRREQLSANAAPIEVGPLLVEKLFSQKRATALVSATFSVDNSFAYAKARLNLPEAAELQLDSPFDYAKSTLLYLPTDMPEPNEKSYQRAVEDALIALCRATGGRALVLFTANHALRQTYHGIQEALERDEISTIAQGLDGSRRSLIQRFKDEPRTVLLGTTSFWEGVDVVGDALSVLVIAKLPFSVPNDPVFSARSEQFDDAFGEYSVPQAILRFKQGFGRLIRSKEDRGIVVVLDRRLTSKNYGRTFVNSLPPCEVTRKPLAELPATAARWLV